MKLTGNPENVQKCFNCNNWTPEKHLKAVTMLGKERYICWGCVSAFEARNEALEKIQDEVEAVERAKARKASEGKH